MEKMTKSEISDLIKGTASESAKFAKNFFISAACYSTAGHFLSSIPRYFGKDANKGSLIGKLMQHIDDSQDFACGLGFMAGMLANFAITGFYFIEAEKGHDELLFIPLATNLYSFFYERLQDYKETKKVKK
jgi:hypothetical protein